MSRWQFIARIGRHIRNAAQYSINEFRISSASPFFEIVNRQQRRRLFGNGRCDELIDGDIVLLGELPDLSMQRIRKSETEIAHCSPSSAARKSPGFMIRTANWPAPEKWRTL